MRNNNFRSGNKKAGIMIAGIMLYAVLILDVFYFFTKTEVPAKLFAAGSFVLLLFLLVPFTIQMFKSIKQGQ